MVALTLTPVLCAMILKPHGHTGHAGPVARRNWAKTVLGWVGGLIALAWMAYLAHHLWGNVGFALLALPVVRKPFDWLVERVGEVNEKFMAALEKRPELSNLSTFYTSDYPQFEPVINNDAAVQKGVSIGKALDNLNILIGSTYEQGAGRR